MSATGQAFAALLEQRVASSSAAPAIEEKRRGQWAFRRWCDVVEEVDRLAAGLARLGVQEGAVVAIDAEINGRIVLIAAAVLSLGGRIVSVPTRASRETRDRVIEDRSVALVVGQGREVVAEWAAVAATGRKVAIVFDHATAGGRAPAEGVVTYDGLRALGAATEPRAGVSNLGTTAAAKVWVEEATDWRHGLDALVTEWVREGWTLAVPERLAAADRDRREARPERWLASAATLERALARLSDHAPQGAGPTARALRRILAGRFGGFAWLLRGRLRRWLGLGRVRDVVLYEGDPRKLSAPGVAVFGWLGAPVSSAREEEPRGAAPPSRPLALAGAAQ